MTDTVQHTVTKILASVEEGSAAYNFVSIINGIIERNNLAAAHAELRGYLGELYFGGERYSGSVPETQTIDALIGFLGRDALIACVDTASRVLRTEGFSKAGQVSYEKIYATGKLLGHISVATAATPEIDGLITAKLFDLSRLALASVQAVETLPDAAPYHRVLQRIVGAASGLNERSTQGIHAPDARGGNGTGGTVFAAPPTTVKDDLTP